MLFSVCHEPSIINDVYNGASFNRSKNLEKLLESLKNAQRVDVSPQGLLETLQLYENDIRRPVMENIAKYSIPLFRVIIPDRFKHIAIPADKRFMVGINDGHRDIHLRAPYVDFVITYDSDCRYKDNPVTFKKPKGKRINPAYDYDPEKNKADKELFNSFLK